MTHAEKSAETRRRLLEAAAEVFTEDGFRDATMQRICRRAKANIAAVHYHFGDKNALYAAVFEWAEERARRDDPPPDGAAGTPEERLRALVTSFLSRLLDPKRPTWFARLLAREMIEPTPMLDRVVRQRVRANHEQLDAILRDLLGPAASVDTVRLCTLSVISQCVFYRNSAPILTRLYPNWAPAKEIERIADHVTRFTLGAARNLRGGAEYREKQHVG